jgi:hypothetical protein
MSRDLVSGDRHVMHASLIDLRQEFAEGDVADLRSLSRLLKQHYQRRDEQPYDGPERYVSEVRVHVRPMQLNFREDHALPIRLERPNWG